MDHLAELKAAVESCWKKVIECHYRCLSWILQKPRNCVAQRNWILKHWKEYRSFQILQCILMKTLSTSNGIRFLCCAPKHTRTLSAAFFSASFIQFICVRMVAHIYTIVWVYRLGLSCQHQKKFAVWIVLAENRFVSIFSSCFFSRSWTAFYWQKLW